MEKNELINKLKTGIYKKYKDHLFGSNGIGEQFCIYQDGHAKLSLIIEDEHGDPIGYKDYKIENVLFELLGEINIIEIEK